MSEYLDFEAFKEYMTDDNEHLPLDETLLLNLTPEVIEVLFKDLLQIDNSKNGKVLKDQADLIFYNQGALDIKNFHEIYDEVFDEITKFQTVAEIANWIQHGKGFNHFQFMALTDDESIIMFVENFNS